MTYTSPRHPQLFYTTAPMPCPYLPERMERKVVTDITGPQAEQLHNRLSSAGFRRSHTIAYAPVCAGCTACVPIRLPVNRFRPDRTQQRIFRRNRELLSMDVLPRATEEQFALFRRYQLSRHGNGDMAGMNAGDYRNMIEDTPIRTFMIEFRDHSGQLICVSLLDRVEDGLSAVYTFFDPDMPRRSLGTYAILYLVERVRMMGLSHLYLGYWIKGSPKMAYKSRFRSAEIMRRGVWTELVEPQHDTSHFLPVLPVTVG
ncbi:arginyltransferase [Novacetimonas hansenii]|uniref:Aspartate/glutamate leucyltransferase n=1 Tax=Novacetimonas hansenii TaxID=436 RepID=A0AAW5EUR9_NOVHA|nr:arginyltransferase [Novacetimonas hansenii]MCJ8355055.1 arginyltransferase [Novacetimonas hansenii]PYD73957.1 arginyltransferase [Novacetimonas hansenii]QOF96367.1 arginyltransferase [Novacetimonas hansenii]RFP03364.1 arginyltransferase [Novacetimonas hansenii]WEQ59282.1 arginyltransferase [Novacetimonas hansenii]